jgi:hypothetical protein
MFWPACDWLAHTHGYTARFSLTGRSGTIGGELFSSSDFQIRFLMTSDSGLSEGCSSESCWLGCCTGITGLLPAFRNHLYGVPFMAQRVDCFREAEEKPEVAQRLDSHNFFGLV